VWLLSQQGESIRFHVTPSGSEPAVSLGFVVVVSFFRSAHDTECGVTAILKQLAVGSTAMKTCLLWRICLDYRSVTGWANRNLPATKLISSTRLGAAVMIFRNHLGFFLCVLLLGMSSATQSASAQHRAVVDRQTGDVTFQGKRGLVGLGLWSAAGLLLAENVTDLQGDATLIDIGLAPDAVGWANFGRFELDESYAGQLFPPNVATYEDIRFDCRNGFGGILNCELFIVNWPVPEPTTACLLAILCFGLAPLRTARCRGS